MTLVGTQDLIGAGPSLSTPGIIRIFTIDDGSGRSELVISLPRTDYDNGTSDLYVPVTEGTTTGLNYVGQTNIVRELEPHESPQVTGSKVITIRTAAASYDLIGDGRSGTQTGVAVFEPTNDPTMERVTVVPAVRVDSGGTTRFVASPVGARPANLEQAQYEFWVPVGTPFESLEVITPAASASLPTYQPAPTRQPAPAPAQPSYEPSPIAPPAQPSGAGVGQALINGMLDLTDAANNAAGTVYDAAGNAIDAAGNYLTQDRSDPDDFVAKTPLVDPDANFAGRAVGAIQSAAGFAGTFDVERADGSSIIYTWDGSSYVAPGEPSISWVQMQALPTAGPGLFGIPGLAPGGGLILVPR